MLAREPESFLLGERDSRCHSTTSFIILRSEKGYPPSIKITVLTFQANQKYNESFRGESIF